MPPDFVYLASGSPRRRELLEQIGVTFRVLSTAVDESLRPGEAAPAYVVRLAAAKAQAGWAARPADCARGDAAAVLAADTAVVLDGKILGKPADQGAAVSMLLQLSGRTHEVLTAVAVRTGEGLHAEMSRSEVTFRPITEHEARAYARTGEPMDKAGAYAVQGRGAVFIAHLQGSFSGVMGLPLFETAGLLQRVGVPDWRRERASP